MVNMYNITLFNINTFEKKSDWKNPIDTLYRIVLILQSYCSNFCGKINHKTTVTSSIELYW